MDPRKNKPTEKSKMKKWLKKTVCKISFNPKFIGNDEFFELMDEIDAEKEKKEEKKLKKICQICDNKLHWYENKCNLSTIAGVKKVHVVCWMEIIEKNDQHNIGLIPEIANEKK